MMNKKIIAFIFIASLVLLSACSKKRPEMSYHKKDRGVVQDIDMVSVTASAKNFKKTSEKFSKDAQKLITKKNPNNRVRRVSLSASSIQSTNSIQGIIDLNAEIKNLETTPVTLKFNKINIRSALRLFSGIVKRNIVIGEEVDGSITLDFQDIRWGSAVYAILEMNNLVMIHDSASGMLRVHTKEKYLEFEKQKVDQTNAMQKNLASLSGDMDAVTDATSTADGVEAPVKTEIFKVFNQESKNVLASLTSVISGLKVIDDTPNNQLIVTGTALQLNQTERILDKIDIEKKSVMVEAFIISAADGFAKVFDANLVAMSTGPARDSGGNITTTIANSGLDGVAIATAASVTPSLNSLDPAASSFGAQTLTGGMLVLGNIGRTQLRALINASVTDTNSESLSNPKLFAIDGEQASLVQGLSLIKVIPAAGDAAATTEEINLNLNLTVTPQIIGGKVKLKLAISNNSLGTGGGDTDTPINNETVNSTVLINDGDVAVIGGVYKNTKTDNIKFIPLLHRIPIVGHFFKDKTKADTKSQLLMFITANIV
jgi:type IV pilus assembly protein PilQ